MANPFFEAIGKFTDPTYRPFSEESDNLFNYDRWDEAWTDFTSGPQNWFNPKTSEEDETKFKQAAFAELVKNLLLFGPSLLWEAFWFVGNVDVWIVLGVGGAAMAAVPLTGGMSIVALYFFAQIVHADSFPFPRLPSEPDRPIYLWELPFKGVKALMNMFGSSEEEGRADA